MKKRIITLLAIVALLVACLAFAVYADTTTGDDTTGGDTTTTTTDVRSTFKCPCSACTAARAAAEAADEEPYYLPLESWTQLPTSGSLTTGGHYWTNTDVEATGTLSTSGEVVILLDGAELKRGGTLGTNGRVFNPAGSSITHLVGNNGAKVLSRPDNTSNGLQGTVAQLYNGTSTVTITFHVYGDLTFSQRSDIEIPAGYGGFFKLASAGAKLWVHDYGTNEGLTNDNDPVFNGLDLVSASESTNNTIRLGDCMYITGGKMILEACTLNGYNGRGIIYQSGGTLVIGAKATFVPGTGSNYDVYKTKAATGYIQVDEDWLKDSTKTMVLRIGDLSIKTHGAPMNKANQMFGNWDPAGDDGKGKFTAISGAYSAIWTGITLYYPDRGNPPLIAWGSKSDGAGFLAPRAQLFKSDGSHEWITSIDTAIDEYNDLKNKTNAYIKLWSYTQNTSMSATETAVIDLNGHNLGITDTNRKITIAEGAKLFLFDSTKTAGNVGASMATTNVQPVTQFNGMTYITVPNAEAGTSTVYPIEVTKAELSGVTLRPGLAGMYFTAESEVTANAAITDLFYTGVAVSVKEITNLADTSWTATQGLKGNGILVQNILKDDLDAAGAAARAEQDLYAEACVTIKIGEDYHLVKLADENIADLNLDKLVSEVATKVYGTLGTQQKYFYDFVTKWQEAFGLWSDLELAPPTTEA